LLSSFVPLFSTFAARSFVLRSDDNFSSGWGAPGDASLAALTTTNFKEGQRQNFLDSSQ
jgi:hypothetical protein